VKGLNLDGKEAIRGGVACMPGLGLVINGSELQTFLKNKDFPVMVMCGSAV